MTMIDYVIEFGEHSFEDSELNDIDATILAQLAYLDFGYLQREGVTKIDDLSTQQIQVAVEATWKAQQNAELLYAMKRSVRFNSVSWHDWVESKNIEAEEQFSAVTFELNQDTRFISYRGTTATITDWKEDFNMTFMTKIPSQVAALKYYKKRQQVAPGDYYLGGHSKGGNLAIYTLVHSQINDQKSVVAAYSIDGPGLNDQIPATNLKQIRKIIPESSVIGLLLEPDTNYKVVKSDAFGFNQHDPHSWQTRGNEFILTATTSTFSQYTQVSIAKWLESLDEATKGEFLDSVFAVIKAANVDNLSELAANWPANLKIILSAVFATDEDTRKRWKAVSNKLRVIMKQEAKERLSQRFAKSAVLPKPDVAASIISRYQKKSDHLN